MNETDTSVLEPPTRSTRLTHILLAGGLALAGVLGLIIVLRFDPVFTMPDELGSYPVNPTAEYIAKYNKAYLWMWGGNTAINFSVIGLCLGIFAALLYGRGLSILSKSLIVVFALLGGALGGLLCGLMLGSAHATQGRFELFGIGLDPMIQSVLFQLLCWGSIGVGIGKALAWGRGWSVVVGALSGVMGGFAAGMLHALIGSVIFPDADISLIMPPGLLQRILWAAYCGGALGLGVWFLQVQTVKQPAVQS